MSYIDASGNYHKEDAPMQEFMPTKTSVWKQADHDRQRQDHKRDLLRPYNADGTPNDAFVEAYPEESQEVYHFTKSAEELAKEQ
jgi:hypothetical protein